MDLDSAPAIFVTDLQDAHIKLFFLTFFFLLLFEGKIYIIFQRHKTVEIKVFLTIFS
jgi:hypothetical protein